MNRLKEEAELIFEFGRHLRLPFFEETFTQYVEKPEPRGFIHELGHFGIVPQVVLDAIRELNILPEPRFQDVRGAYIPGESLRLNRDEFKLRDCFVDRGFMQAAMIPAWFVDIFYEVQKSSFEPLKERLNHILFEIYAGGSLEWILERTETSVIRWEYELVNHLGLVEFQQKPFWGISEPVLFNHSGIDFQRSKFLGNRQGTVLDSEVGAVLKVLIERCLSANSLKLEYESCCEKVNEIRYDCGRRQISDAEPFVQATLLSQRI